MGDAPTSDPSVASERRTDTRDPRRSREWALKILFQADVRQVSPEVTLGRLTDDAAARAMLDEVDDLADDRELLPPIAQEPGVEVKRVPDAEAGSEASSGTGRRRPGTPHGRRGGGGADRGDGLDGFTRSLVLGVHEHRERIDELISRFARRWQISRMPVVDRSVLRLATYELLYETTSPAVVIHEAVALAKDLSTDDSGRYVNGVLESVRKHLAAQPAETAVPDAADAPPEPSTEASTEAPEPSEPSTEA